ncbi:MAG: L7Ae/L30e/S12e/Gadd45 family ribosomal protein [Anaerolineae bacterium]
MEEVIYHLLEKLERPGLLKRGAQESLVSIERGRAHLVIVARDASEKVREFILSRARLKGVPSLSVSEGRRLGRSSGLRVGATAVAVLDPELAGKILSITKAQRH